MTRRKRKPKRAEYKSLFEWRIANGLADTWLILVAGRQASELFTLDQIRQMQLNSPRSVIHVLNAALAQDPEAEWLRYREPMARRRRSRSPNFYEHFACAFGTLVLVFLLVALIFRVRIEAGLIGLIGFPVVSFVYALIRRASETRRLRDFESIEQELSQLKCNLVSIETEKQRDAEQAPARQRPHAVLTNST